MEDEGKPARKKGPTSVSYIIYTLLHMSMSGVLSGHTQNPTLRNTCMHYFISVSDTIYGNYCNIRGLHGLCDCHLVTGLT